MSHVINKKDRNSRIKARKKKNVTVRFKKPKNNLSQENEAKTGRTIFHY